MRNQPFARAIAMMKLVAQAMQLPAHLQRAALAQIGPYQSRGKGMGRRSGKKPGNSTGKTYPMNGARECARRRNRGW